jgi:hypothetical protein
VLVAERDTIHVPVACLAEIDFALERADIERCSVLLGQYRKLDIGVSDASRAPSEAV